MNWFLYLKYNFVRIIIYCIVRVLSNNFYFMYDKKNKLHIVSVVAVIRGNNKYLVLKRPEREVAYPNMYTFPGGKVENNDTIEETGLKLKSGKILLKGKSFTRTDGQTVKVFSYLCSMENIDNLKLTEDFV